MKSYNAILAIIGAVMLVGCIQSWDSASSPDLLGPGAMAGVSRFVATNGWNMISHSPPFEVSGSKPITDLPWKRMSGETFPAVTENGILYVLSNPGWHHDSAGVAYNPNTNKFEPTIRGFKPVGGHWYVWFQPEFQSETFVQKYE